jgi:hypothetical protein
MSVSPILFYALNVQWFSVMHKLQCVAQNVQPGVIDHIVSGLKVRQTIPSIVMKVSDFMS